MPLRRRGYRTITVNRDLDRAIRGGIQNGGIRHSRYPCNDALVGMTKSVPSATARYRPVRLHPFQEGITARGAATVVGQNEHRRIELLAPVSHPLMFSHG